MSGDNGGAVAPLNARLARPPWKTLTDRQKVERLDSDLLAAERRIAEVEGELLETQNRLRLSFRELGRLRGRLRSLALTIEAAEGQLVWEIAEDES